MQKRKKLINDFDIKKLNTIIMVWQRTGSRDKYTNKPKPYFYCGPKFLKKGGEIEEHPGRRS